jgi:hypothetical protein
MKTWSSISVLVALTSLAACSASSGPEGKAVGNDNGGTPVVEAAERAARAETR